MYDILTITDYACVYDTPVTLLCVLRTCAHYALQKHIYGLLRAVGDTSPTNLAAC